MEWQQILGFYHLARLGSFTQAAAATWRTQSALSQQIKALEEEWQCQLVERLGRRRLRLTPAGERFYNFCKAILARQEQWHDELHELQQFPQGRLSLAAPFTTLYHLAGPPLQQFRQAFPQVQVTILDRSQTQVVELVKAGEVDFGVALNNAAPPNLAVWRWRPVEVFLMVPAGHPLGQKQPVTLEDIAGYPLILPPKSPKARRRHALEEAMQQRGLTYQVVMESSNVELSSLYVEMGVGLSFATMVPGLNLAAARRLELLSLRHYFEPDHLAVLARKDKALTSCRRAFLDLLLGG